jgi:ABC-type transport system substrate-binding protein
VLRTRINIIEVKEYKATIELYWNGVHDGIADFPGGGATDPDVTMTRYQQNSPFKMFPNPVPFDDLLKKQRQEVDVNKRVELWKEIQRQWATQVTDISAMTPGLARNMNVAWPQLENYAAIRPWATGTPMEAYTYYWFDKTKV